MSAKFLIFLHAIFSVALAGSSVHSGIVAISHLLGRSVRPHLLRLYPKIVLWLYVPTMLLGALAYPTFRVDVRAAYFDQDLTWATALFEIKEHWVALGLVFAIAQVGLRSTLAAQDRSVPSFVADGLAILVMLVVVYAALVGFGLVLLRPV